MIKTTKAKAEELRLKEMVTRDVNGYATLNLHAPGDPSVGISGCDATVKLWLGPDVTLWAWFWDTLRATFEDMWDNGKVEAYFSGPVCDSQEHHTDEEYNRCPICSGDQMYNQMRLLERIAARDKERLTK